ncbi:ABC transporter ATP-binding protein [Alkaliphilus sp. B6464]|uniref:ABC transporter ATP-binding protein n=1 Tax=Alkaliphilus sp. B6464 TaxID=2731219 RepID=UPI001BAADE7C|nr:ABC transporter ATP-binding protein [Alkaliphilus sp. B6464]QUH18583.1 ABC transporter ATP-binding protein [Alkaliphilus sp. B6464]
MLSTNIKTLKYFFKLTNRISKTYILKSILASVFKAWTPFLNIIIPKLIIDELLGGKSIKRLIIYVVVLTIGNLLLKIINNHFIRIMELARIDLFNKMDSYLGEKCVDMDFENIENPEVLDLKERAFFSIYNLDAIGRTLENASIIIYETITLLGLGYILAILNPIIIAVVLFIVFVNSFIFKKIEKIRFEDNQKAIFDNRAFGYFLRMTSDFSMGKDIRLYKVAPLILKKSKYFTDNLLHIYSRQFTAIGKYSGISNINMQIQMIFIYAYLAMGVIKETIGIGSFTMYANAVKNFSTSIMSLVNSIIEINQMCMYLELFIKFDSIESKNSRGSISTSNIKDFEIEFKNISFKYPNKKEYTLKNISIVIKTGEKLSVVGLNGAGKTTFIKLISRLYEPTEGSILLGGVDIKEYTYEEYMKLLAIVFQDFKLLSFSIRDNLSNKICEGRDDEEIIISCLDKVGFGDDLAKLNNGIDTNIYKNFDEKGIEFSGGQAQKIAIARALYKDSPIVILDEPTSALDPISEYEVYNSFNNLVKGKTAIYISHRLSSTRFSDRIAVFKDGEIIEYGNHYDLIKNEDSLYANMYNTQATYYVT